MNSKNKSGQTTIFIIIGILIVAAVLLFFILKNNNGPQTPSVPSESGTKSFLQNCIESKVYDAVGIIGEHGGYIDLANSGLKHKEFLLQENPSPIDIVYLCYTEGYSTQCTNQEPLLLNKVTEEIKEYINQTVDKCVSDLGISLDDQGYVVDMQYNPGDFNLSLSRGRINLNVNANIALTKADEVRRETEFNLRFDSGIYDIIMFPVSSILRKKTSSISCYFDAAGYSLFYNEFIVKPTVFGSGEEVYTIENKKTNERFVFAVRSCISPSGYGA